MVNFTPFIDYSHGDLKGTDGISDCVSVLIKVYFFTRFLHWVGLKVAFKISLAFLALTPQVRGFSPLIKELTLN